MTGTVYLGNLGWLYHTGISFVGVVSYYDNGLAQIAVPGKSFVFDPKCSIDNKARVEAEIKRQIRQRWPEMFQKQSRRAKQ